jgi:hypothetical protein
MVKWKQKYLITTLKGYGKIKNKNNSLLHLKLMVK